MLKPEQIKLLELYHGNKLPASERKQVEQSLLNSSETKAEALEYMDLLDGFAALELEHFEEQMQQWEHKHNDNIATSTDTNKTFSIGLFFRKYRFAAAAVILVLLLPLGLLFMSNPQQQIFADNFSHYEDFVVSSGVRAATPAEDQPTKKQENLAEKVMLNKGMKHYTDHDYEQAAKNLSQYLKMTDDPMHREEITLYLSIAQIANGETAKAENQLKELSKTATSNNMQEAADWYLGLNYLKMNEGKKAKKIFKKIARSKKHRYHEKAVKLLPKLDRITK